MSSQNSHTSRNGRREQAEAFMARAQHSEQRIRLLIWGVVLVVLAGIITAMMLTSRPESSAAQRPAPDFALTDTAGHTVNLSSYRGKSNVLLYFYLLDDGTVSEAYDTLGKGMHAGLPGHSFVLIDEQGEQRWYGEYPSMWLEPQDLLKEVQKRRS